MTEAAGETYELVVVGAGPAGLAAASEAARLGIATLVLDEQPAPGGQIFRAVEGASESRRAILGRTFARGRALVEAFRASGAGYLPGGKVWQVADGPGPLEVGVSVAGRARIIRARRVILATGALERPFPIPGWTLPGVIAAGGAQALLKSQGMLPEGLVVLAGTGPLLWLFAAQILRAGGRIGCILDTTARENRGGAWRHLPAFAVSPWLAEGLSLMRSVGRRVRVVRGVTSLTARGGERLSEIVFRAAGQDEQRIPADLLLLHQGVVPDLNLAAAAGCRLAWDARRLAFAPLTDEWGASSCEGIAIAGDAAGILGAEAAVPGGRLAAIDAAFRLGRLSQEERDRRAVGLRKTLRHLAAARPFLDLWFRPARGFRIPEGKTIACRCEEVTASSIREAALLGCAGPNQLKAYLRAGMGPCQGRFCGLTVSALIADARGVGMAEVGYFRLRPPARPLTLGELATLPVTEAAVAAVER